MAGDRQALVGHSIRSYEEVIAAQLTSLSVPTVCLQGAGKTLGDTVTALQRLEAVGIAERADRGMRSHGTWWRRGPRWAEAPGQVEEGATDVR